MHFDVEFNISEQSFTPSFGEVRNISDGGYERGYAAGYEDGSLIGMAKLDSLITADITFLSSNADEVADYALRGRQQLSEVNLPNVARVGIYGFYQCSKIELLDFPNVKELNNSAFAQCANLKTIILRNEYVVTLKNTNCFTGTPILTGTGYIYVPDNLVEQYKVATNWSTYAAQIKPLSELEGDT